MPKTLDELRRELAASGGATPKVDLRANPQPSQQPPGASPKSQAPPTGKARLDMERLRASRAKEVSASPGRTGKFTIKTDGKDAMLCFGKHRGLSVSQVAVSDPGYIQWMMRADGFDKALIDVCKYVYDREYGLKLSPPTDATGLRPLGFGDLEPLDSDPEGDDDDF